MGFTRTLLTLLLAITLACLMSLFLCLAPGDSFYWRSHRLISANIWSRNVTQQEHGRENSEIGADDCTKKALTAECFNQTAHIIQPHRFKFVLNQRDLCESPTLTLLIFIVSRVDDSAARVAQRNAWASIGALPKSSVKVVFLLGSTDNNTVQMKVTEEATRYHDILQEDFVDSYGNLTLKTIMALRWASAYCSHAKWIMKTDTDVFVNVTRLMNYLQELETIHRGNGSFPLQTGLIGRGFRPHRDPSSKWYVSESMYPMSVYPSFAFGPCYVISGDLAGSLFDMSQRTPFFPLEDVFLGIVMQKLGAKMISHPDFVNIETPFHATIGLCKYRNLFCVHGVSPAAMLQLWNNITNGDLKCS